MTEDFLLLFKDCQFFDLNQMIGSGTFSQIYQATLKDGTSRKIAVKCYKKSVSSAYSRAASEIAFFQILKHPNIAEYVTASLDIPCVFLGVEFSPYGSLSNLLGTTPLQESLVRLIIRQIVAAVYYLQCMSICHGDIKPDNIIVTQNSPEYIVKLVDFGLAEVVARGQKNRRGCGSLYYMAPELLLNLPCDLSTDLFSVGVVMHEMLFCQKPFPHGNKDTHIDFIRSGTKLLKKSFKGLVSRHCSDLLKKLLSHDKADRPMGDALKSHPFLKKITEVDIDYAGHYTEAFVCLERSAMLAKENNFGTAHMEGMQACIRLKIFISSEYCNATMLTYVELRLHEFNNSVVKDTGVINVFSDPESFRSLLICTPNLLTAYDMCNVGAILIDEHQVAKGAKLLRDGLRQLWNNIRLEPQGNRKRLLLWRMSLWDKLLEGIAALPVYS